MNEVELPRGWAWAKVGAIADSVQPGFPHGQYNIEGKGAPHLRPMNIDGHGSLSLTELKYVDVANPPLLNAGDILFNNTNSPTWVGKTTLIRESDTFTFSNHMTRIRLKPGLGISGFFAWQLQYLQQAGYFQERCTHHVNQASISSGYLSEQVSLRIAPQAEQRRIVAAIEEQFTRLDAGVAALKRAQVALKRYRAAVLKAAVEGRLSEAWRAAHPDVEPASVLLGRILVERRAKWEADLRAKGKDPAKARYEEPWSPETEGLPELPQGWVWATVEQLVTYLRNGLSQKPENAPPGHRILRINAVRPMSVDLDEVRYLDLPVETVADYFVKDGDLLYTRYNGSRDLLGVAGMVRGCDKATLHPDKLIRVQVIERHVLPSYIELASNTGYSRSHIEGRARTTAGQTGISGSDIKQMPIPLPTQAEQEEIVAEVERRISVVDELDAVLAANLKRAERLRQAILERAFTGRLVPQNPADEPASALLARIRGEQSSDRRVESVGRLSGVAAQAQLPTETARRVTRLTQEPLW